jgi:glycosyltransferase involved in cell wall biosynthesis
MRVLVLHSELGTLRGGGENFTRNLFASFLSLGHQVRAAFTADPFGRYPFPLPAGVEDMPICGWWSETFGQATLSAIGRRLTARPSLRSKWDYVQNALQWRTFRWNNRRFQRRIVREIEQAVRDIDVVYVHSNPFLASEVAQIRPTVLRLPGPLTSELLPVLRNIHAVCANGDALKRIRSFLGQAIELPVGLDERLFAPGPALARSSLGWTAQHLIIGYVGRLSHIKGVDLLAESFQVVSRNRREARLLIVGSGEEEKNLRATLKPAISRGLVHFAGDVSHEDLPNWYRAMDVLAMPSRYENYSNAVLEGFACGIPFVGSDVGGNRAMCETGAGWLFEPSSAGSLATVLEDALADTDELKKRGKTGLEHIRGRHSWLASAKRLEEIISSLPLSTGCTTTPSAN